MANAFKETLIVLLDSIIQVMQLPFMLLLAASAVFALLCAFWWAYFRVTGVRGHRSDYRRWKEPPLLYRLAVLTPKRFVLDKFERPPNFFSVCGLIVYEGMQGSGKTSSMVHEIRKLQYMYPHVKVITNFGYTGQDAELQHYSQLVDYKNGFEGVIVGMDELQNWFSSRQSANFPPEMLSVVTQNRKNRRVIFGTAQSFYMLAKDIRTQCTELRRCCTFFGCLTFVHRIRPICDSAGEVKKLKHLGWYCWVHDKEDRDSYDTYKAIQSLSDSGFKSPSARPSRWDK